MEHRRQSERQQERSVFQDRRKKDDWVTVSATVFSIFAWLVSFGVVVVLDMASPENVNMFSQMFDVAVREHWDESLLPVAFYLLTASLCICIAAFIFNVLRKRRRTDKYKKSIIIAGIVDIATIIFFLIRFGNVWAL